VANSAARARLILAAWFDGDPGVEERTQFRSERLGQVVAAAGNSDSFRTWESAVQFYLAAVAARQSWPQRFDGPAREIADELRLGLRYPKKVEIGRYTKNEKGGPTLNREEATKLGRDLARFIQSDDYRRSPQPMDLIESPD
jgi:hypothetical protein